MNEINKLFFNTHTLKIIEICEYVRAENIENNFLITILIYLSILLITAKVCVRLSNPK